MVILINLKKYIYKKATIVKTKTILKEEIINEQELIDYCISFILLIGSLGFLITGISSFANLNLVGFLKSNEILFFPQGITMCFYGTIGSITSCYQLINLYSKIGQGYNEINKEKGTLEIYRKGYPGKNDDIKITIQIKDIEAVKLENTSKILNSKQTIFICLKEKKYIPIIQINNPINTNKLEKKATEIASFLNVSLKEK
uniref:Photosystem I assembly protein Ycf4 n=1 Tax=Phacus pleuronectes TaxID=102908 RepID=A0A3G3LLU9_9EUGL|nr:photosystem I assembly protein ycf4 [Phacus pleuronectes]AYQ93681.1 photosystem I assembly protein ycf4 [Phacus pleuronectes]